jgi:hypothetical protein
MSFENPLDRIKKMNAENEVKKSQEEALEKEQEIQSQENTDTQYELVGDQNQAYSEQVIQLKERIADITGTQEEMIAEYGKVIDEAKWLKDTQGEYLLHEIDDDEGNKKGDKIKNIKTLQYVRDNFDKIFSGAKKQWKEVGSEKIETIESQKGFEESITELDSRLEELYPKTTTGKEELAVKELEALNNELADIELTDTIKNKWQIIQESKWQENNAEKFISDKEELIAEYQNLVEEYKTLGGDDVYHLPQFEDLKVTKYNGRHNQLDIKEGLDKYESNTFHSDILNMDQEISKVKGSYFKRGLSRLTLERYNLKSKKAEQNEAYKKLYSIKRLVEEKMGALYEKNSLRELSTSTEKIGDTRMGIVFLEIEKDKSMSSEQKAVIERHNEIQSLLKEV